MKWKKSNGSVVETNDLPATVKAAKSAGWTVVKKAKKKTSRKK